MHKVRNAGMQQMQGSEEENALLGNRMAQRQRQELFLVCQRSAAKGYVDLRRELVSEDEKAD